MKVSLLALLFSLILLYSITLVPNVDAVGFEVRDKEGHLISSANGASNGNPLEFGVWAIPLITINLVILAFGIFYHKNKIQHKIKNSLNFIFQFEVSKKVTVVVIASLLAIYVGLNINEIEHPNEEPWGDFPGVFAYDKNWTMTTSLQDVLLNFRYFLQAISLNILGNVEIIPFIGSILLLILTYYITYQISKKRFSGIISIVILLQSHLFLEYSASATYDNFWTFFYLLSLYLIYKKWYLSPISYFFSFLSKQLTTIFLPMTFFFIYRSGISKKEKIQNILSYSLVTILIVIGLVTGSTNISNLSNLNFKSKEFLDGFNAFGSFLRFDGIILIFILPLIVGLYITSRRGLLQADSIMILILGVLLSSPILAGLTDYTNQPYRYVPLVVFFAIGIGTLISNKVDKTTPNQQNYVSLAVFLVSIAIVLICLTSVVFPALIDSQIKSF